ncbi:Fibronectin type III domain-containing protein [Agromyces sp. CF514]|uniref:Ig-like domain-containing protein n=1 Tax=Agromyces sp. CF514 TaxID=1881031 RepID=UPI0008E0B2F4|nr:Ig-like domain-containing protein [Agromyces sp. CF514]SFR75244.1 Fibronectin type III domain-containing protein [Agromyces sp. CF514]
MAGFTSWFRTRKTVATTTAIAVLVGAPVTLAVLHQGFPVTDPDLRAREVWVTNAEDLLAGRLNRQIEELDAAVSTASNDTDVFQNGDDAFVYDPAAGSIERIDPSFTTLSQRIDVPPASKIAYGGDVLAVLSPSGELWNVQAGAELQFDWRGTDPIAKLGDGAEVAVSDEGTIFATSIEKGTLKRFGRGSVGDPQTTKIADLGEHQLSAVGERAVVLDEERNAVVVDGRVTELPDEALRLQQSSAENDAVYVATATGLIEIGLDDGETRELDAEAPAGSSGAADVAAPVWLDGCVHGAWAEAGRYLASCDGEKPRLLDIEQPTAGARLEFRVNRDVIALNNLANGNAWLVDSELRLVDNWEEVTPPEESEELEGDEKSAQQTFEDTIAERTDQNRPPVAREDDFGARPGRTTILEVLENDTDPDGDVLTVSSVTAIPETMGRIEQIDGSRALQFSPAEGAAGTVSFRYGVDDGRGGVAEASVNVRIVPDSENTAPASSRSGAISVEQGQQVSYNVLADWRDPDGDDLYLVNASPIGGDSVRFSPDGNLTFQHKSAELGQKEVQFTISDGQTAATGTLTVDVKPSGSLNPIGTPDFARVFVGEKTLVEPLVNDLSPSGAPLALLGVEEAPGGVEITPNLERGSITFAAAEPGDYVFVYNLGAGAAVSVGLIRVQVVEQPAEVLAPIAVKDTAYLRPGEPLSIPVLANDVSPSGRVLAVQSVDDTATEGLVSVELLTNTVARVTASAAIDRQLQFAYTVSDGVSSATSTVTVVPVPPLVKNQPPVAVDDAAIVRAGDIVTVPVTKNDFHPDAAAFHVLPELQSGDDLKGLAFVDDDTVRYQAPDEPGVYSLSYAITDDTEQTAKAKVTFTVTPRSSDGNRPPLPTPITSRTFAGSGVKIDIPLDGLDPDGDSVTLTRITTAPSLGQVTDLTSTSMLYAAMPGSAGTDTFTYEVRDTYGATATGTIRIGVIPRPIVQLPPTAVDDAIEMKPGRTASVEVLLNDSDPSGYSLHVASLPDVGEGLKAEIRDLRRVVVEAPEQEGAYTIRYEISNGHGGADAAFLQIAVTEDAVILPPTAEDQVIEPEEVLEGEPVTVVPLAEATNPGGLVEDLVVTVEGPNASKAEVDADGRITVKPGRERYAVAYRLTNDLDDLSAMAFVIVPPVPGGQAAEETQAPQETEKPKTPEELQAEEKAKFPAPYLKDLDPIVVPMNGEIAWSVDDLVEVPSGNPALILSANASSTESEVQVDGTNLQYVPTKDYRGPATLTFEVTDGKGADDPIGRTAILTLPITVGDPEFNDTPPTFTPRSETIEAGEKPSSIDLRQSSDQPNPDNIERITYTNLSGTSADIQAEIVDGATLQFSAPLGVQPGTDARITFDVNFNEFTVPGYVDVKVVSSTRAMPKTVDDGDFEMDRTDSETFDVLANDFNPFAQDGVPLRVVAAEIDQASVGANASTTFTATGVTVNTGAAFTGTLSVIYTVEDGTKDPLRRTTGRVTVVVRAAPDAPNTPTASASDARASVRWAAPATNNSPITDYEVSWSQGGGGTQPFGASAAGTAQTITGLANGTTYSFKVRAKNDKGWGAWSSLSPSVIPYGTPSAPRNVSAGASGYAPATVTVNWNPPSDTGGGAVEYTVTLGSATKTVTGTSASFGGVGAGSYTARVTATNNGSGSTGPADSTSVGVSNAPPPQPSGSIGKGGSMACGSGGNGCAEVRITFANMDPGTYRIYARVNGGAVGSYKGTYTIGSSGQLQLQNHLGIRQASETIDVQFDAISGGTSRTLGGISGSQWNAKGYNTW